MNAEKSWTSSLLDGSLNLEHAAALAACLRREPEVLALVTTELRTADLTSRALDPARTDNVFLRQLEKRLSDDS